MGKLIEILPMILRVFSRARVLSGALQSRTTRDPDDERGAGYTE